jgi:membrane associated rhomboid family serine protease
MDELHHPDHPHFDAEAQRRFDRRRLLRAFNLSLACVFALVLAFSAQASFDWRPLAVQPWSIEGLLGLLTAPLLHGSIEHIAANSVSLLILGTLAGSVYPKATLRALPLLWLGSGLGAWLLGVAGTYHLGASGVTHGLMFLIFGLGVLRRDRASIAAGMIAFLFYGGMLLAVLPQEPGVSWQSHLGGALAGLLAALLWRRSDPALPKKKYSWEIEEEQAQRIDDELEPPAPRDVPVLWRRMPNGEVRGVVLQFPPRQPPADSP